MIRSIYTINRSMNVLQKKQENASANIANINTPGYKFQDLISSSLESHQRLIHAADETLSKAVNEIGRV